jgi:septum formation protein
MIWLDKKIVLGSGSPRRKLLLQEIGLDFRVLISDTDETPLPHHSGEEIAIHLAQEKAEALKDKINENEILVTADTIVWLDELFGKPLNEKIAFEMLKKLNGKKHIVFTGVCLLNKNFKVSFHVESSVYFKNLSDNEIKEYIQLYKPFDKAGSYGAQECLPHGINPCSDKEINFMKSYGLEKLFMNTQTIDSRKRIPLIDHIDGSYFNVMGLPIVELVDELKSIEYGK